MAKEILQVKTFRAPQSLWRKLEQWRDRYAPASSLSNVIRDLIVSGMKK